MSTTDAGRVGEAAALSELSKQGWYPFIDISGKCPVDIIAWKDGVTKTFQVKSTSSTKNGSWEVQIGSIRPNRTGNVIHKFDSGVVDYLVVYIEPIDTVCFIESSGITQGRMLSIREKHSNGRSKSSRLIKDCLIIR